MRILSPTTVLGLILASCCLAACPNEAAAPSDEGPGGTTATTSFGSSACFTCQRVGCEPEIAACSASAPCAQHLNCALACPAADEAGADDNESCRAACPPPQVAEDEELKAALDRCLARQECADCDGAKSPHPILEQTCAAPTAVDACDRCEEERCCDTRCDKRCEAFAFCMQLCTDNSCRSACYDTHPEGVVATGSWLACTGVRCRDDCKSGVQGGACFECIFSRCDETVANCLADADCAERWWCGDFCENEACYDACDESNPGGVALFEQMLICAARECIGGPCAGKPPF